MMPFAGTEIVRCNRVPRTVRAAKPFHQPSHVNLHRALADTESSRYRLPTQALAAYELDDLALPGR